MTRELNGPAVERAGATALWVALLALLGGVLVALRLGAPFLSIVAVPGLLLGLLGIALIARRPDLQLAAMLCGVVLILSSDPGLQAGEIVYFLIYPLYHGAWYGARLIRRERLLHDPADYIVMLLLVFGLGGGLVLGVLFGGSGSYLIGEALSFSMFLFYFPAKEVALRYRHGFALIAGSLVWLSVVNVVTNTFAAYQAITTATQAWQVVDVRVPSNEILLLIPAVGTLPLLAAVRRPLHVALLLALFCVVFAGLIITKSRGYWVGWVVSVGVILILLEKGRRGQFVRRAALTFGAFGAVVSVLFGGLAVALLVGSFNRFATLSTAFSSDISWLNRLYESAAVWAQVRENPIVGYGFGTPYAAYSVESGGTRVWSFIHNGYLALWYKLGLWGLLLVMGLWGRAIWCGVRASRSNRLPLIERMFALGGTASLIGIAVTFYTSSPFFVQNNVLATTVVMALVCAAYEHMQRGAPGGGAA